MKKKNISEIEQKIIAYCQQRNIPITNGKVPQKYQAEIMDFVKGQIRTGKKRLDEFNKLSITPALKPYLKGKK